MNPNLVPLPVKIVPAPDLIRRYTSLDGPDRHHLESLMAFWSLLADLSFSDLLLFAPVTRDRGEGNEGAREPGSSGSLITEHGGAFVILGQIRPTTSQTLYEVDLVGQVQSAESLTNVVEAYQAGAIVASEQPGESADALVRVTNIPVGHRGKVLGVLCRVWSPQTTRRPGTLERVYLDLFERLSVMVADGLYPFEGGPAAVEEAPRVGDGVIVVDAQERITYASPNAVNALHRASITSSIVGSSLALLGLQTSVIDDAFAGRVPTIEEVERPPDVILMIRCIPLIARDELTGAALLLRDVTDLRRRDRLLLTKDATIREVHHRVKNNLQTISSLLRLQARRLGEAEAAGRIALLEAERRIRAIALVHDILARDAHGAGALRRDRPGARQHDPRDEHDLVPGDHRGRRRARGHRGRGGDTARGRDRGAASERHGARFSRALLRGEHAVGGSGAGAGGSAGFGAGWPAGDLSNRRARRSRATRRARRPWGSCARQRMWVARGIRHRPDA